MKNIRHIPLLLLMLTGSCLLVSAQSNELVDTILPPADPSRTDLPPMAIAVLEDYHLLGLRVVYSALRASGYALQNYGRWTALRALAYFDTPEVRTYLLESLTRERDAGRFMSAARVSRRNWSCAAGSAAAKRIGSNARSSLSRRSRRNGEIAPPRFRTCCAIPWINSPTTITEEIALVTDISGV